LIRIIGIKLLIILLINFLRAEEYIVSFQLSTRNYIQTFENFTCSKKLTQTAGKKKFLFKIDCEINDILKCCNRYRSEIINNLITSKIVITGGDEISYRKNSYTKLTFLPASFDIILKDEKMYFYLKEPH